MRILLTSPVFPPDLGGPAVLVPSMARFFVERGHHVKVVAFCSEKNPTGYPFEVVTIPPAPIPIRYLMAFFAVLREAKGYDVVYVNEHLALLHVLAARLRRRRVAIRIMVDGAWEIAHRKGWCHGDDIATFQTKKYGFSVRLTRFLQKRWWNWSHHIISCSEFLRQILIQNYGVSPDKVQRIHNGYNGPDPASVKETKAEAREALGLRPDLQYVITICRLMDWKGVDGIITALKGLPDKVHLLVVGDGDMRDAWEQHARDLGIAERIHFLGGVPYKQVPLYIRGADLFVLNSRYEGLSLVMLEVMHLGTPMIAGRVCGNGEILKDGASGYLVNPRDPDELREKIKTLLDDPARCDAFVAEGLKRAVRFDRNARFSEVEEALKKVAGL